MNNAAFPEGISSGDTNQTSTVLWARSATPSDLAFAVSTSSDFSTILNPVTVHVADPTLPAKVEIDGLAPSTTYYYRVTNSAGVSEIGHFETAAAAGMHAGFQLGVSGDWRGELAPYPSISNAD